MGCNSGGIPAACAGAVVRCGLISCTEGEGAERLKQSDRAAKLRGRRRNCGPSRSTGSETRLGRAQVQFNAGTHSESARVLRPPMRERTRWILIDWFSARARLNMTAAPNGARLGILPQHLPRPHDGLEER